MGGRKEGKGKVGGGSREKDRESLDIGELPRYLSSVKVLY
jgi:hypothetical protein